MSELFIDIQDVVGNFHIVEFLHREAKFYLDHAQDEERGMKAPQPYHRFEGSQGYPKHGRGV